MKRNCGRSTFQLFFFLVRSKIICPMRASKKKERNTARERKKETKKKYNIIDVQKIDFSKVNMSY